jgi:hypothetical protein
MFQHPVHLQAKKSGQTLMGLAAEGRCLQALRAGDDQARFKPP